MFQCTDVILDNKVKKSSFSYENEMRMRMKCFTLHFPSKKILSASVRNPLSVGLYTFPGMMTFIKNISCIMRALKCYKKCPKKRNLKFRGCQNKPLCKNPQNKDRNKLECLVHVSDTEAEREGEGVSLLMYMLNIVRLVRE